MNAQQLGRAEKQLVAVEGDLQRIASLVSGEYETSIEWREVAALVSEASASLATASLTLRSAEETLSRETSMDKRQHGKQKLKELRTSHQKLKDRIDQFKSRVKDAERTLARTGLLSASPQVTGPASAPDATHVQITREALAEREEHTLGYAENRLSEYISLGGGTLDSLRTQRSLLKGAQRRVLDAGTSLGISQSLMRIIRRRTAQDRYIFYGGLVAVFLVIYLCWKYII